MAKNSKSKSKSTALKQKTVKKVEVKLADGTVLMVPNVTADQVPFGLRRKTRHLKNEEAQEELFWLILETFLTPEELEAWDSCDPDTAAEAMESMEAIEEQKKE